MRIVITLFLYFISAFITAKPSSTKPETITVAIIVKDMAHTLPTYLNCIEKQTWPKEKTNLYIRTNDNKDATADILRTWLQRVRGHYNAIFFDDSTIDTSLQQYELHEWSSLRFKILGSIRQASVNWAREQNSHYFIADADNFIKPDTIEKLLQTGLPVVAPLLQKSKKWNDHCTFYTTNPTKKNVFKTKTKLHKKLLSQKIKAITQVPIVHCTYFIRHEVLDKVCYDDNSGRWEFIIFSETLHKHNITQHIDTREIYGYLTSAEDEERFSSWIKPFLHETWLHQATGVIPKNNLAHKPYLWVYWENVNNAPTPGYISLCRKTLLKHCSHSFTIFELDEKNIYDYLPELKDLEQQYDFTHLSIPQRVDIYRILLLHKYGGLYLDADMIVMRDLKEITDHLHSYDFVGFGDYNRKKHQRWGRPENWAMASRPQGVFITSVVTTLLKELEVNKSPQYHTFGKTLLKKVLQPLLKTKKYHYYHYKNTLDGTRDRAKKIINTEKMFSEKQIRYKKPHRLLFIPLYGSGMGDKLKQLTEKELLATNTNFSRFIQKSLAC